MSDRDKSFDFATDTTKQLITLSTAVLALTITFAKDILGGNAPRYCPTDLVGQFPYTVGDPDRGLLAATWILYLISIVFGVLTMQALTHRIASGGSVDDKAVRVVAIIQNLFFGAATLLIVIFGINAIV